jgi:ornithine carbamoyltransferase
VRHFLRDDDLSPAEQARVLAMAADLKRSPQPDPQVVDEATRVADGTEGSVVLEPDAHAADAGADVVVTDTWVSMGTESEGEARSEVFRGHAVTSALFAEAKPDAIAMHCLPAYRGKEIDAEVIDGPRSVVWDEVENRRHAQKAILAFLLEDPE